jgi:acyl-CoA ligase (AMP-forming) (exosortase A-associated)
MDRLDALLACGAPDDVALKDGSEALGYAALDALVSRLAGALSERLAPGDRLAFWLPKSCKAVALMLAASRAGAVLVPVNPVLRARQVGHILADSGATMLITHAARAAGLGGALPPACALATIEDEWERWCSSAPFQGEVPAGDALAALLYTSGSTGSPKGVMVTHRNLVLGATSVSSYLGTARDDRVLALLPLSFDFGLSQLTTAFVRGASAILMDYLAPRDVVRAVASHGATQLAAVPPLFQQLVELEWPDAARAPLRTLSCSGGRLAVPTVRALRNLFPQARLHLMYGLTEAFRSTSLPPELVDRHPGSIGRAIPGAEVLVVRPDFSLAADGEAGELVHCGPLVTRGYWRDPERTAERFQPAPPSSRYGGVAVWSGDTVVRDGEGLLSFVGRRDEMIKVSGTRVSPTEVEELALASGAVSAAVAFGVADAALGTVIRLVGVPTGDLSPDAAERQLGAFFRREAPAYLHPASFVWLDRMPLSPNGKIDRASLRADRGAA